MSATVGRQLQEYSRTAEQTARDSLIVGHLWLVRHLIGKISARLPAGVDVENLQAAGVLGLVEAASRFDASRGVDFKAFAALRIRGAIIDEARRNCPLPQDVLRRVTLVAKAHERLASPATVEDLVRETGLTSDEVLDALIAMPFVHVRSLEQLETDPEGEGHAEESAQEREEQKQLLAEAILALPERERLVITLYYKEDLRLKEIGQVLKLSESRVSRILASAQLQLRQYICSRS